MCVCRAIEGQLSEMMGPGVRIVAERPNLDGQILVEVDLQKEGAKGKGTRLFSVFEMKYFDMTH